MTSTVDVAVIGGGLLGWSVAYRLTDSGRRVTVIDRSDAGYATQAGAGIVAPGTSLAAADAFYPIAQAGVEEYERLIPELAERGETGTGYDRVGMLFVARDDAEWERLPEAWRRMSQRRAGGMGNVGEMRMVDNAGARALFPPLAEIPGAIHLEGPARVNAASLRDALRRAALRLGATATASDARLVRQGDRIASVTAGLETLLPETVVIAGGAWSSGLVDAIGLRLRVEPQRGQIIHLDLPGVETSRWPILGWFGSQYMLTFPTNRVVAGATREHGSGFDVRMTAGGVKEVLDVALSVAPGLATATIAEIRIGLRPVSPDGLPLLGRAPGLENLYLCTGHGPSGITLGPISGRIITDLIAGKPPDLDLTPFRPDRFT